MRSAEASVHIEPWGPDDVALLIELNGDPLMMEYLGGPESPEKIVERHARYLKNAAIQPTFKVVENTTGSSVGWVGYWETVFRDEPAYDTGWSIARRAQGNGYATMATDQILALAKAEGKHQYIRAFPSVENAASNAVCRKAGFTHIDECETEFPPGRFVISNYWRLDLTSWSAAA